MGWIGTWKNQYGSTVEITDESDHKIAGVFRTALDDSGFRGQAIPVFGVHQGDCISFAGGGVTPAGDGLVSYTGLLRDGKMETLWYVVADSALGASSEGVPAVRTRLPWWRAISTNADTFERV
jgi:hypothetical protein